MVLDDGICTILTRTDVAEKGHMPDYVWTVKDCQYYGRRDFAITPAKAHAGQTGLRIAKKIRIPRNDTITTQDIVVLAQVEDLPEDMAAYAVANAYHGTDDDNGLQITDLYLEVYVP